MDKTDQAPSPPLRVTEVRISLHNDPKLKDFASMTLNSGFVVRGLKVIQGNKGFFVAMPSRKQTDGTFQDIAHPVSNEVRRYLEQELLSAYWKEVGGQSAGCPPQSIQTPTPWRAVLHERCRSKRNALTTLFL